MDETHIDQRRFGRHPDFKTEWTGIHQGNRNLAIKTLGLILKLGKVDPASLEAGTKVGETAYQKIDNQIGFFRIGFERKRGCRLYIGPLPSHECLILGIRRADECDPEYEGEIRARRAAMIQEHQT